MSSIVQLLSNFSVVTACGVSPESFHWYEGWGAAVIGALVGGICAWIVVVFTTDFSACKQTCLSLYELKKILRRLASYAEHRNQGDRLDNRIENLELWDRSQPAGQRVDEKIKWCVEFLTKHGYNAEK